MRPRRHRPTWKRLLLEYVAMLLVYVAVLYLSGGVIIALIAMIASMFVLRATRPNPDEPPPPPGSGRL